MRLLPLLLALAACAAPAPVYHPVEVPVPVAVPCHPPHITPPTLTTPPPQAPLFTQVQALLVELDLRRAYETRLQAALNACD